MSSRLALPTPHTHLVLSVTCRGKQYRVCYTRVFFPALHCLVKKTGMAAMATFRVFFKDITIPHTKQAVYAWCGTEFSNNWLWSVGTEAFQWEVLNVVTCLSLGCALGPLAIHGRCQDGRQLFFAWQTYSLQLPLFQRQLISESQMQGCGNRIQVSYYLECSLRHLMGLCEIQEAWLDVLLAWSSKAFLIFWAVSHRILWKEWLLLLFFGIVPECMKGPNENATYTIQTCLPAMLPGSGIYWKWGVLLPAIQESFPICGERGRHGMTYHFPMERNHIGANFTWESGP